MKRIALAVLIALLSLNGFAQIVDKVDKAKKVVTVKKSQPQQPQSAVVDFSEPAEPITGTVVYGRIDENGDTTLIV